MEMMDFVAAMPLFAISTRITPAAVRGDVLGDRLVAVVSALDSAGAEDGARRDVAPVGERGSAGAARAV